MHLFWKDNALFIKKKKFLFDKNIKKAFIFDDTPTILTDTIIFIDEFPYSFYCKGIPIFENSKMYLSNLINDNYEKIETCHLNNFLFYKSENKIFLLQHKLSNPEFLFSCRLDFLEVTDNYFLLGREDKMYLKKKHCDLTLEIIFAESMISFKSVCFDEINNDPHKYSGMFYLKSNNFLIFYSETKVFFLNEKNLEFKFLKMNLKRVEIAKLNNKEYLLLNDNLFDGFDLLKCGALVDIILSLTHFGLTGENVCQNFVKIKQSENEIFEKRLAKSPSPYNFIKENIKNLTDFEFAKKIKEYYLNNEEKESQENKIEKIISPADLQDYLFNFDPNVIINIRANDINLSKNGVIKNDLNFYDIFNKNLNQNENLTGTNTLKKFYCIKSNLQIRQKIFNEPPNINYLKKISSLTLENLDSKTKEALNLCFEPVKSYVPDENDFENKKLKFFKIKKQAQSPFILYSSLKPSFLINGFNNAIVRTLMTDYNDYIGMINEDNEGGICLTNTIKHEIEESEIYKIINNYLLEKKEYTSEEVGGLILGLGIRKTYHKILNTEIDFINAMSLIASSLTNEGKKDSSLLNNLKVKNLTINVGTVISLGYSFKNTNNSLIIDLLIKECNKYGSVNKQWYDEIYRLISGYSLILLHKKRYLNDLFLNYKINHFIKLDDKLVEVIVNGILFWNTKDNKILKKLKRNTNDRLEEIFYSEFFTLGVLNKKIKVPSLEKGLNLQEIYRLAGKLFYLGVYCFMNDEQNEEIYKKLKKECLMVEQEMLINREYKILYDTLLVILCLIYNGTCDLKILKILRRSLNLTTNLRLNDFIFGKFETNYFLRYGDFLRYKMCTGLLFCGLGRFNLKKDCLVDLIYAFYINFPLTEEDQKLFTFFRHNLASKFELKPNLIISDWSKEDKKILFDLFGWYYEEVGEIGLPLSTFMS